MAIVSNNAVLFQENNVASSYSDFLFAYRKETARILKLSNGDIPTIFQHGLDALVSRDIITKAEAKNLAACIAETLKARQGEADIKKTLTYLQNTSAKAIIGRNSNSFYLNFINLCTGLVREVEGKKFPSKTGGISLARATVSTTFPAGSGGAILAGAIGGAVIGSGFGGPLGGFLGGLIGGLIGSSNDVDVDVSTDPAGGGPA